MIVLDFDDLQDLASFDDFEDDAGFC